MDDIPRLVVLPPVDLYGSEGEPIQFSAPTRWLDLIGQPDDPATVGSSTVRWNWSYGSGATYTAPGQSAPTHTFGAGEHIVEAQFTDSHGFTGSAVLNVWIDELAPVVSAGTDLTIQAGTSVGFTGTATDYDGIASVGWDFDYDGETFAGTLTPGIAGLVATHKFVTPGTYWVALRAIDNDGFASLDVITVTVTDVAPSGTVVLAPVRPDGSAQTLREGATVYFDVNDVGYSDPTVTPSLWADWDGDGTFDLVPSDQWLAQSLGFDGSNVTTSFTVAHTYHDGGLYTARFRVSDPVGQFTASSASVLIANVAPTATLVSPSGSVSPGQTYTFTLTNVTDPSAADTRAGFKYDFQVYVAGDTLSQVGENPSFVIANPIPGRLYHVVAAVRDKDGAWSQDYVADVQVLSDQVFRNGGTGRVMLKWTTVDGDPGALEVGAGNSHQFVQELSGLTVDLLDADRTYDLATNFRFDSINGNNLTGVTLAARTDSNSLPSIYQAGDTRPVPFVGDGYIGAIGAGGAFVSVSSRGDFGGLTEQGAGAVTATYLRFRNQTGPISVTNAGTIAATGTVSNVRVRLAVDVLSAYSVGDVQTATGPGANTERGIVVTVGPGGFTGPGLDTGVQLAKRTLYRVDAVGRITYFQQGPVGNNHAVEYEYSSIDGLVWKARDHYGEWIFGRNNGAPVITTRAPRAPADAVPGSRPPAPTQPAPSGWAEEVWDGAVALYDAAADKVAYAAQELTRVIELAGKQVEVWASEQWSRAGEVITWADGVVTEAGEQVRRTGMYLGNKFVEASRGAAEAFMKKVGEYGGTFAQLLDKIEKFGTAAEDVLKAVIRDPETFAANVLGAVGDGFQQFFDNLGGTLKTKMFEWLTGGISIPDLPSTLNADTMAPWLLSVFRLNWDGVQEILVNAVGAGNIALLAQGYEYLEAAWNNGGGDSEVFKAVNALLAQVAGPGGIVDKLDPKKLVEDGIEAIANMVVTEIAKKAPVVILQKLNPGGAVLSTIYNGVTWLLDNKDKLGKMLDQWGTILGKVQALANAAGGPATNTAKVELANVVKAALDAGVGPALSFAAAQLKLSDLPKRVTDTLKQLQALPRQKVEAAVQALVNKAKGLLGLNGPNAAQYQGALTKPITFTIGGENHRLWIINQNGKVEILRASNAFPVINAKTLIQGLPAWQLAAENQVLRIQGFIDAIRDVGKQSIDTAADLLRLTRGTAEQIQAQAAAIRGDLKKLRDLEKQLDELETKVIKELQTALQTTWTYTNEPLTPEPSNGWNGWLESLDRDALGRAKPASANGNYPGTNFKLHAHHIVLKDGNDQARTADASFVARQILWRYVQNVNNRTELLNPYWGRGNLAWAPNWSHTNDYAGDVLNELLIVKDQGPAKVQATLKTIALKYINATWHAK
ncbi:MAG TPA: PKD domain-containing protein [Gemmata sp.]